MSFIKSDLEPGYPRTWLSLILLLMCAFLNKDSIIHAEVSSTSGNIIFEINDESPHEMALNSTGLGIGSNLIPSTNLHIDGNAIVSQKLAIGENSIGSSNLNLSGTISFSLLETSSNSSLASHSHIVADSSTGNVLLGLPDASTEPGRIIMIKKSSTSHIVNIAGGGNIDGGFGVQLNSGNLGHLKVISAMGNWHILSISDNNELTPWSPQSSTNIIAWYDADDSSTIQVTGGLVDTWEDKSGSGANLMASGTERPTTGSIINSLNAIDFDGSNDFMNTSLNPFGVTINDACVFFVFERDRAQGVRDNWFALNGIGGSNSWEILCWSWDNPDGMMRFYTNDTEDAIRDVTTDFSTGPHLLTFYDYPSTNLKEIYLDGSLIEDSDPGGTFSTFASRGATTVSGNIHVGKANPGIDEFDGRFAEIIVVNKALSTHERQQFEGYLAHKWGTEEDLDADHPFRYAPPPQ